MMTSRFDAYAQILASRDRGLVGLALLSLAVVAGWWVVDRLRLPERWSRIVHNVLYGLVIVLAGVTVLLGSTW